MSKAKRSTGKTATEQQNIARPVEFAGGLYQIAPDATAGDVYEQISTRLDQMHGITVAIHGGGSEHFNNCSQEVQAQILSGLFDMVSEVRELFTIYDDMPRGE